ncbi:MAG: DinB family protein [Actinomycetales bacterium]|jgi:hypothetical protein|nr:DinB family protein [Candidatus Phosphoribacter baldrii]
MVPKPAVPPADDKDWTWVLREPCKECGFDAATIRPKRLAEAVRETASRWPAVLVQPEVAERPKKHVWSPLEYACHVRDVMRLFAERVELMLAQDNPVFANWDQDETAQQDRYWAQDPATVAKQIGKAGEALALVFERVTKEDWHRPGTRSNGSEFTIATLGIYALHDLRHHVWDVRG